jgi:hypothetical protein
LSIVELKDGKLSVETSRVSPWRNTWKCPIWLKKLQFKSKSPRSPPVTSVMAFSIQADATSCNMPSWGVLLDPSTVHEFDPCPFKVGILWHQLAISSWECSWRLNNKPTMSKVDIRLPVALIITVGDGKSWIFIMFKMSATISFLKPLLVI